MTIPPNQRTLQIRQNKKSGIQPFSPLYMASALSNHENNALWAGSLLAVPPPAPGTQPLAGLMTVNLPGNSLTQWATHIQDVTSSMRLPPEVVVNCPQADIVGVLN